MSIPTLNALSAYSRVMKTLEPAPVAPAQNSPGATANFDFNGMVENMVTDTAKTLRGAENASVKQVAGQGDLIDVVTAIGAAESALNTVVAVRDRMVNAYNEIMRMQI